MDGKTVGKSYDSAGNVASVTNEEGQTTTYAYDAANRLVSVTRATGNGDRADDDNFLRRHVLLDSPGDR